MNPRATLDQFDLFAYLREPEVTEPTKPTGRQLRDAGIAGAAFHADAVVPSWSDKAYDLFVALAGQGVEFTTEKVRLLCAEMKLLPEPPDNRAWGAVAMRARKAGVIEHSGRYTPSTDPKCHHRPVAVWRAAGGR